MLLAPALGERNRLQVLLDGGELGACLVIASACLSMLSIVCAAWVIASTLSRRDAERHPSLMFTDNVAQDSGDDHERRIRHLSETRLIDDLAYLAQLLAVGVSRKFRFINASVAAFVGAVLLAFVAMTGSGPAQPATNTSLPLSASTFTVSPLPKVPLRISDANGFSICCWMARLSGRAPYTGSKPTLPSNS